MGKCLNSGSCFNGKCICQEGFSGEFCEDKEGEFSLTWLWVILIIGLLGGAGFLCYKYRENIVNLFKRGPSFLTQKGRKADIAFNEANSNNGENNIVNN